GFARRVRGHPARGHLSSALAAGGHRSAQTGGPAQVLHLPTLRIRAIVRRESGEHSDWRGISCAAGRTTAVSALSLRRAGQCEATGAGTLAESSLWVGTTETTLFITMLSTETPQLWPGRTSTQVPLPSCVNS